MTQADTPKPQGIDLYAHPNGQIIIRVPKGDGTQWSVHDLGTTNLETARKGLRRYLSKNKITGIDAEKALVNSRYGQLEDNGVPVARRIREKRIASGEYKAHKGNGRALVPYIEENAAKARAALARQRERSKRMERAGPMIAALAASMEAAAINLRELQSIITGDDE